MKTSRIFAMLLASAMMNRVIDNDPPSFRGMAIGGYNPMFTPRKGKFKGYMRENRRSSFKKTK